MAFKLYEYQQEAVDKMKNGCILYGGVGSGKTITSLSFYKKRYNNMKLYIITPSKKRDSKDWENEAASLGLDILDIHVDSWNNIKKYKSVKNAFFIFDEHKISNYGTWSKSLIEISRNNKFILLTATPGDNWMDYITIFIANGFYKNKTQFINRHVVYDPFSKYPKVKKYVNIDLLIKHQQNIFVKMKRPDAVKIIRVVDKIYHKYDVELYDRVKKDLFNPYTNEPIQNVTELIGCLRRVCSETTDKYVTLYRLIKDIPRCIIFYNYKYERDLIIQTLQNIRTIYQYNGMIHDPTPTDTEGEWVYLVQYNASEAWNCIATNIIIFYSLNYSYKIDEQCKGRIDRLNTSHKVLKYYYLVSKSSIDTSIAKCLKRKEIFNENTWKVV